VAFGPRYDWAAGAVRVIHPATQRYAGRRVRHNLSGHDPEKIFRRHRTNFLPKWISPRFCVASFSPEKVFVRDNASLHRRARSLRTPLRQEIECRFVETLIGRNYPAAFRRLSGAS
jgi:hypothetical protein